MSRPKIYQTKNKDKIMNYIKAKGSNHFTAQDISEYFIEQGQSMGLSTIYRFLDFLVQSGELHRFTVEAKQGACFQYIDNHDNYKGEFHMKCISCESIIHLECSKVQDTLEHIQQEHNFQIQPENTVFYGLCKRCGSI